ncbi:phenoloxidase 1-like [Planococcus citri]|uniref:phenoloxidase 1-like n=1 Tax=Planococcus citri TaxID=170843 RepID=UPI0031F9237F
MSANVPDQLLDVVCLLQTVARQNVQKPQFENLQEPEPVEAPLTRPNKKRRLEKSYAISNPFAATKESENPLRDQYFEAVKFASKLRKRARMETFNPFHQKCASYLINIFYRIPLHKLKEAVEYAQTQVNISLLNYALSVALLHRDDAVEANIQLPSHLTTEPGMYSDMEKVRDNMSNPKANQVMASEVPKRYVDMTNNFTATNLDPENKVAYFREDIGLSLHHRHWHEVYPFEAGDFIAKKNRRGELFYYMHQQAVARYNFDRFSNGLPRVEPFENFREPIKEAYFPKLNQTARSTLFSSRPANCKWHNLHRGDFYIKISTMDRWRDRIFDAIDRGYAYAIDPHTKKEIIKKIDEETGINELANTIEAAESLSWNYRYYGNFHNTGHLLFSYVHDPDHRFQEESGVMSASEAAMRDPLFYRWHAFVDDIFQRYKRTLPPYTIEQRQFKGIEINDVKIRYQEPMPDNDDDDEVDHCNMSNVLRTYWEKDAVDITQGLLKQDVNETNERVYAVFTHLQHRDFEYKIEVKNTLHHDVIGTVRIFLAPHADESGSQDTFNGQRRMFIEMDKFTANLPAEEITNIKRKSVESSVTIPFEKTFMTLSDVQQLVKNDENKLDKDWIKAQNGYCGCGWPHHMLIGKGVPGKGLECDLFVMITNYEDDRVDESPLHQECCDKSSLSYCGVRNKKYPDKKPMGFPFDRTIPNLHATINDFMTDKQEDFERQKKEDPGMEMPPRLSNMIVVPVRVKHEDGPPTCGKTLKDAGFNEEIYV